MAGINLGSGISLLIAERGQLVREALASRIRLHWPLATIYEVDDEGELLETVGRLHPGLVVLSVGTCFREGIIERLCDREPGVKLVIAGALSPAEARAALVAGADALIPPSAHLDFFLRLLDRVWQGETYVPRDVALALAGCATAKAQIDAPTARPSARELELLAFIVAGHPNKLIAHRLNISESAVKAYLRSLFQKLGVHNRTQAAALGLKRGLVAETKTFVALNH